MTYFLHIGNKEGCCDELCWIVSGRRAESLMLFLGVRCVIKILKGAGVVDGGNSERCLSGMMGSLRNLS